LADTPSALEADPQGWVKLLPPGSDLTSWSRFALKGNQKISLENQWSVDPATGTLICEGDKGHEWLRYDKEYKNLIFHVEWRFVPKPDESFYISGIFIRNGEKGILWHQAEVGGTTGGWFIAETLVNGEVAHLDLRSQLKESRVKPAGEWNTYEITANGKRLSIWVNGAITNELENCEVPKGYIGLEAEGYKIEFRNLQVKELP
jgi:hypothetical protein